MVNGCDKNQRSCIEISMRGCDNNTEMMVANGPDRGEPRELMLSELNAGTIFENIRHGEATF